jgi:hypothetical protein
MEKECKKKEIEYGNNFSRVWWITRLAMWRHSTHHRWRLVQCGSGGQGRGGWGFQTTNLTRLELWIKANQGPRTKQANHLHSTATLMQPTKGGA